MDECVAIVVRTIGRRHDLLLRALSSLKRNTYRPLEVVIVYQGVDDGVFETMRQLCEKSGDFSVQVVINRKSHDSRSENLNLGWQSSHARYMGFLDDDDTLLPEHLTLHVEALRASKHVWSYSQTILSRESSTGSVLLEERPFVHKKFDYRALVQQNFIPIHSFLLDRLNLASELQERPFCDELTRSEDWDFLIRLAYFHEPVSLSQFTCRYTVLVDGENTNISLLSLEERGKRQDEQAIWARNEGLLKQRVDKLLARNWWLPSLLASYDEGLRTLKSQTIGESSTSNLLKESFRRLRTKVLRFFVVTRRREPKQ